MVESPHGQSNGSVEKVQCVFRLIARTIDPCILIWLIIFEYPFCVNGSSSRDDICDASIRLIAEELLSVWSVGISCWPFLMNCTSVSIASRLRGTPLACVSHWSRSESPAIVVRFVCGAETQSTSDSLLSSDWHCPFLIETTKASFGHGSKSKRFQSSLRRLGCRLSQDMVKRVCRNNLYKHDTNHE